ncbi:MAG: hypothetical protein ACKVQS_14635 [Fimbriimonadaceae bacterium]
MNNKIIGILIAVSASVGIGVLFYGQLKTIDSKNDFRSIYEMPVYTNKSLDPEKLKVKLDKIEGYAKQHPNSPQLSELLAAAYADSAYVQVTLDQFLQTYDRFEPILQSLKDRTKCDSEIRSALSRYYESPNPRFSPDQFQTALKLFTLLIGSREANTDVASYISLFASLNQDPDWQLYLIRYAKTLPIQPKNSNIYALIEHSANQLGKPFSLSFTDWKSKKTISISSVKPPFALIISRKVPTDPQDIQFLKDVVKNQAKSKYKLIVHSIGPPSEHNKLSADLPQEGLIYTYGSKAKMFDYFPQDIQRVVLYTDPNSNYVGFDRGQKILPNHR